MVTLNHKLDILGLSTLILLIIIIRNLDAITSKVLSYPPLKNNVSSEAFEEHSASLDHLSYLQPSVAYIFLQLSETHVIKSEEHR